MGVYNDSKNTRRGYIEKRYGKGRETEIAVGKARRSVRFAMQEKRKYELSLRRREKDEVLFKG